nr:unnamed protein product [Spirometra erinaceieuropaei]
MARTNPHLGVPPHPLVHTTNDQDFNQHNRDLEAGTSEAAPRRAANAWLGSHTVGNRNELPIRGRLLQLADLLSWDAKCNRLLHDLVVSCYGAPDYVAQAAVGRSKSYKYNRKFPFNLSIPPSQSGMPREPEPQRPNSEKHPSADPKRRQEVHETRTEDEYASGRANGSTPTDNEGR